MESSMSSVQDYLNQHSLEQVVADAMNACVKARETDPFGYLARYFEKRSPSVIRGVHAGYLFDNKGTPVTYVDVTTFRGVFRGTCPYSDYPGIHELPEMRDDDPAKFHGLGVMRSVYCIQEKLAPILIGKDPRNQTELDHLIRKFSKYINVLYPLSVALCKAGACESNMTVSEYLRFMSESGPATACHHIVSFFRFGTFMEIFLCSPNLDLLAEIKTPVQSVESPEEALAVASHAIEGVSPVFLGIRMNASEFITERNQYTLGNHTMTRDQMIENYVQWADAFPLMFIEDPFDQDDWNSFRALKEASSGTFFVWGNHLYASSATRIRESWTHAAVLEPSAAGTVTGVLNAAKRAHELGMQIVVSSRSGDVTTETFEKDLAQGISAQFLRFGRLEKFNN